MGQHVGARQLPKRTHVSLRYEILSGLPLLKILLAGRNKMMLDTEKSFLEIRDFKVFTTAAAQEVMDLAPVSIIHT